MKRTTKILVIGREAHVVSCANNVDTSSAESIVEAIAHGHVKLVGTGLVVGDTIKQTVDTSGKPMHFPNRAERLVLRDVEKRRSFAKLFDIMPESIKSQSSDSEWHEERRSVECYNCHSEIQGKRRVKGEEVQIFQPDDKKNVTHKGRKWYCGCTTSPTIPKHPVKKNKKDLFPFMKGGNVATPSAGTMTMTFNGSPDQIDQMIKEYIKGRK